MKSPPPTLREQRLFLGWRQKARLNQSEKFPFGNGYAGIVWRTPNCVVARHSWFLDEIKIRMGAFSPLAPVCYRWLFGEVEELLGSATESGRPLFPAVLEMLDLKYNCAPDEILSIPQKGPVILVSNHPYGIVEVLILGAILNGVRGDVRFLAHYMAKSVPQIRDLVFPIDPVRGQGSLAINQRSLKQSVRHLRAGGALVLFPAGRQASFDFSTRGIREGPWTRTAALFSKWTDAPVLPVFFHGCNSWRFYAATTIHPLLGDAFAGRELTNKRGRTIRTSIGVPLESPDLLKGRGLRAATEYLRAQTLALADRATLAQGPASSNMLDFR